MASIARLQGRTALDRLARRRAAAVGRGVLFGLYEIPGVVFAEVCDHGTEGVAMEPGTALVEVWGGDADAVLEQVRREAPANVFALVVHRAPTRWVRLRGWLRVQLARLRGRL